MSNKPEMSYYLYVTGDVTCFIIAVSIVSTHFFLKYWETLITDVLYVFGVKLDFKKIANFQINISNLEKTL